MINIPTRAIIIPTHKQEANEETGLQEIEYFDIVYYWNTGYSVMFHSMTTTVPLEELEPHLEQMEELKIATEIHIPNSGDEPEINSLLTEARQAHVRIQMQQAEQTEQSIQGRS